MEHLCVFAVKTRTAFKNNKTNSARILKELLWGGKGDGPYPRFLRKHAQMPNGLPGSCERLIRMDQVHYVINDQFENHVLPKASNWDTFGEFIKSKNFASSTVLNILKDLGANPSSKPEPFTVLKLLELEIPESRQVSTKLASNLGEVFNNKFLEDLDESSLLEELLEQAKFTSQGGNHAKAIELIFKNSSSEEESLIYNFTRKDGASTTVI